MFGFFAGAWAVATVDIERTFHLTDAGLGLLLAAGILAATAVAAVGGAVTDKYGAGRSLTRALIAWGAFLALEAFAPHLAVFVPVFVLAMAAGGLVDVVMNIVAADALVARRREAGPVPRPVQRRLCRGRSRHRRRAPTRARRGAWFGSESRSSGSSPAS